MEQFLQVGVISSTHGIRGEVKVFPTTDDPARFKKLKKVLLDTGKERLELEVQSVKFFKQFVILKFRDIDNINDIEKYKGRSLLVPREDAVKLEKDEYFIAWKQEPMRSILLTRMSTVKCLFLQSGSAFWTWMWKNAS